MTTNNRERFVTDVDPELDRLVNDEGMCQVKASQRLYAPGVEFPIRERPTGDQVLAFVDEHVDIELLTDWQRAVLRDLYDGRALRPVFDRSVLATPRSAMRGPRSAPPPGRWDFRAVLRWLTGGRRP